MINNVSDREIKELKKIGKYTKNNIKKLQKNYPIQYLIGYVNFYGLKIKVNKNTLIPRYETEYLVEKTIKYLKQYNFTNPKILDICTGTGAIGLTLKSELPNSEVTISDISRKALKVAKYNKSNLKLEVKIIKSDLFDKIKPEKYDLIISNPPYVMEDEILPENVKFEPSLALFSGKKGIDHIEKIFINIKDYLNDKSIVALEINEKSKKDLTILIKKYFDKNYIYKFETDLANKTRYLFIFKNIE